MSSTPPEISITTQAQSEMLRSRSVYLHTLGCKLNYAETTSIGQQFLGHGFELAASFEEANVVVLNTCSVTENAEKECRKLVRRMLRTSPNLFVAVTGCYAQLRPEEIASISGVDVVFGAKQKFALFEHVSSFEKRTSPLILSDPIDEATDFYLATSESSIGRTRAFLKVQDGCDYKCSFCTIPEARGASRSGSIAQIVNEAIELSEKGFLEIILSGVNVGDFGRKDGSSFYELLLALSREERITARIRISSIEPNLLTDAIIELIANSPKFCRHFHLPLQSGSAKVLKLMQRRYNRDHYRGRVELIKRMMPDACIGADVIVGSPGEDGADFDDSYQFIESLPISYLHVFTYSERPGTKATTMLDRVDIHERRERNERLRALSDVKLKAFYRTQIGKTADVVLEGRNLNCASDDMAISEGYTDNYVRVAFDKNIAAHITSVKASLLAIGDSNMMGEVIDILSTRSSRTIELPVLA
jgi:threonylcarbamoyladenosine tRNA methylthiotransferase MtaB